MAVSYKKLWKLLIDKDMKKKDLCARAGISSASVTKMGRNGHVTTEILLNVVDREHQMHVTLQTGEHRVTVKKSLIDFLDSCPAFEYKIN